MLHSRLVETAGRLPCHAVVPALRRRLDAENAPEDLLDDVWLSELSRLLPELREGYPDLAPLAAELASPVRQFGAVTALIDALAVRRPVIWLVDNAQWADAASNDLLAYLAAHWDAQSQAVMLLLTLSSDVPLTDDVALGEWERAGPLARRLEPLAPGVLVAVMATQP